MQKHALAQEIQQTVPPRERVGSGDETSHKLAHKHQPLWSPTEGEVVGTVSQRVKEAHRATSIPHVLLHEEHLRRDNLPLPLDPSLLLFLILDVL